MKRDWDLIKTLLEKTESLESNKILRLDEVLPDDEALVFEHVVMLKEAGFLEASVSRLHTGQPGGMAAVKRLTWDGHEFLDQIRSETVWNKVKEMAKKAGLELTIEVVKKLAPKALESLLA